MRVVVNDPRLSADCDFIAMTERPVNPRRALIGRISRTKIQAASEYRFEEVIGSEASE